MHLYLAVDKLTHLVSLQAMVDILTVFPSYLILFVDVSTSTSAHQCTERSEIIGDAERTKLRGGDATEERGEGKRDKKTNRQTDIRSKRQKHR